ncbi:MAG: hypothetical protein AAF215_05755 [Cyanobacteria bacterium P01_A01_bin.123]
MNIDDPVEEITMTCQFCNLASKEQLATICESTLAISTPMGGYDAILTESRALPFDLLKAQIKLLDRHCPGIETCSWIY